MVATLFMDLNTTSFSIFSATLSAVLLTSGEILCQLFHWQMLSTNPCHAHLQLSSCFSLAACIREFGID